MLCLRWNRHCFHGKRITLLDFQLGFARGQYKTCLFYTSRNDSDPVKDLIRNSSVTNFFYSLGVEISGYLTGCSLRGESVAMACHQVRRALHLKKGQFDEKIEELVGNATYGGELRIYFNAMFDRRFD